jgi:hypothetical protein
MVHSRMHSLKSFFSLSLSRCVRLSSLGTAATVWPNVPAPDDRWWWWWLWSNWWNANWHGKPKYSKKTLPSDSLSTINPTWPDPDSNPGRRCGKPATNRLSYGAALYESHFNANQKLHFPFNWTISRIFVFSPRVIFIRSVLILS